LLGDALLDTGENILAHADAMVALLREVGGSEAIQAASYLVYAGEYLNKPHDVISKAFGQADADLAVETSKLIQVQRQARAIQSSAVNAHPPGLQSENVRRMLFAVAIGFALANPAVPGCQPLARALGSGG
jgi:GTP pyrophosphokinase